MQSSVFLKPRIIDVQNITPYHASSHGAVRAWLWPYAGQRAPRTLLSSMSGYAATEVQIAGVLHEYSTLDGVQEDVVDILLTSRASC